MVNFKISPQPSKKKYYFVEFFLLVSVHNWSILLSSNRESSDSGWEKVKRVKLKRESSWWQWKYIEKEKWKNLIISWKIVTIENAKRCWIFALVWLCLAKHSFLVVLNIYANYQITSYTIALLLCGIKIIRHSWSVDGNICSSAHAAINRSTRPDFMSFLSASRPVKWLIFNYSRRKRVGGAYFQHSHTSHWPSWF